MNDTVKTIFHNNYKLTSKCKKLVGRKDLKNNSHQLTNYPGKRFRQSKDNTRINICTYCFSDVIIEDYE